MAVRLSDVSAEYTPGPAEAAANSESLSEFCENLITQEIIDIVVEHTNTQIEHYSSEILRKGRNLPSHCYHTNSIEIRAYCGVLYYAGSWKSTGVDIKSYGITQMV